ncbi:MAG: heme ABC transporter ATP-binding protein [Alteromonadaceae bacterium]|nr:heme ABC transporter ATP-binding protein [Alteromonadaceae bacterium]
MIRLRDVSFSIRGRAILSDVSLDCAGGTVTALCGPNGAGKSTLLAVIAGDLVPDGGTVELQGRPLPGLSVRALAQIRSVFPQGAPIRFGYTVEEVVAMGRAFRDLPPAEDAAAIDRAMEEAEVAHLAYRNAQSLSGGEKARTTFARVRVQDTPVVMLDEPTAALDLRHQEKVLLGARAMAAGGATVIVVLHDLNLAAAHADRIVLMAEGRIAELGTPAEVLTEEAVSRVYRQEVCVLTHPRRGCPVVLIT